MEISMRYDIVSINQKYRGMEHFDMEEKLASLFRDKYLIKKVDIFVADAKGYQLCKKKGIFKQQTELIIFDDFSTSYVVEDVLKIIEKNEKEKSLKHGNCYMCLMSVSNAQKEKCTYFNGKSFCHFVFFDIQKKNLLCDKDFYYSGSKMVKDIIDILCSAS